MKLILSALLFLSIGVNTYAQSKLKTGRWLAKMQITSEDVLPFEMIIDKDQNSYLIRVINAEENITLTKPKAIENDSLEVEFPYFRNNFV